MKIKKLEQELKESNITIIKEAEKKDLDFFTSSLKESSYDAESGELKVILIEAGTNEGKMRHYPAATIQEAAPHFSGLKMYIDHQTVREEREKPERSIKDWASTIVESWGEDGKAMAKVAIHDPWLKERMKDPIFREHIGLSINASGRISTGKVNGKDMQIVEKIEMYRRNGPASVDWVTEAGARGRIVKQVKESGGYSMELKEASVEDIKRENPELLKSIREAVAKDIKESDEAKNTEKKLQEAQAQIAEYQKKDKKAEQQKVVESFLAEKKNLPDVAKDRIKESIQDREFSTDTELKEALAKALDSELKYLNQLSEKGKIKFSSDSSSKSKDSDIVESIQGDVDKEFGVEEKDDEKKD